MSDGSSGFAALGVLWVLFALVIGILWILIPFAIFGIKPLLRDLIREQKATQALLSTISQQVYPIAVEIASKPNASRAHAVVPRAEGTTLPPKR